MALPTGLLKTGSMESIHLSARYAGPIATRAALKAITAKGRADGMLAMIATDGSLWRYSLTSVLTTDEAEELAIEPTDGVGCWLRNVGAFTARIPVTFSAADGATIWTIPEGFAVRVTGLPYWEVTVVPAGGSSPAVGIASSRTGFTAAGAVLGGASGDVLAGLGVGIQAGTIGTGLDTLAEVNAALFEEADTFTFERITSAFTSGSGFMCLPVSIALAPATP